jgi:hypothetical protein
MYALIDISNQMLEDSAFDMEGEIRGEATEQFAVKEGAEIRGTVRAGQKSCSVYETTGIGARDPLEADGQWRILARWEMSGVGTPRLWLLVTAFHPSGTFRPSPPNGSFGSNYEIPVARGWSA